MKIKIAKLLPAKALKNLALTEKLWEPLAREVLYRCLDLTDGNVLGKWMDVNRDKCSEYVRVLYFPVVGSAVRLNLGFERFSDKPPDPDHKHQQLLRSFPNLSYLSLHNGPVPNSLFLSPSTETLKVLKLDSCSISLYQLVTLLNHFCNLEHLSLCYVTGKQKKGLLLPELRHHPEKLTLTGTGGDIHRELLDLPLAYKQLAFDLCPVYVTVQDFIDKSRESLEYLEFGSDLVGMYHNSPMICPEITDWNPWFCFRFQSIPHILRVHQPAKSRDG